MIRRSQVPFHFLGCIADQRIITVTALGALAQEGNAAAQFILAKNYQTGTRAPLDPVQAVAWFSLAAEQGHMEAQYELGHAYLRGSGVEQDFEQAAYWFEGSADQDFVDAQFAIGTAYARGEGVVFESCSTQQCGGAIWSRRDL